MKPDGSDLRVITSGVGIHEVPSWSPNGRRIVFDFSPEPTPSAPGFETRLWTMRADGSHAGRCRCASADSTPSRGTHRTAAGSPSIACASPTTASSSRRSFIVATRGAPPVRRLTPWRLNSEQPDVVARQPLDHLRQLARRNDPGVRPNGHEAPHDRARERAVSAATSPGSHPTAPRILFMCENQGTLTRRPPTTTRTSA